MAGDTAQGMSIVLYHAPPQNHSLTFVSQECVCNATPVPSSSQASTLVVSIK